MAAALVALTLLALASSLHTQPCDAARVAQVSVSLDNTVTLPEPTSSTQAQQQQQEQQQQAKEVQEGPLHVVRNAAGDLVEEPEAIPEPKPAADPAVLAATLDSLYQEGAPVQTRHARKVLMMGGAGAARTGGAGHGASASASAQSSGGHRRVFNFRGA